MVVEAGPCSAFEVVESNLALRVLVVALNAPAELHQPCELTVTGRRWKVRDVVPPLLLCGTPFADQPQLFRGRTAFRVSLGEMNTREGKAAGRRPALAVGNGHIAVIERRTELGDGSRSTMTVPITCWRWSTTACPTRRVRMTARWPREVNARQPDEVPTTPRYERVTEIRAVTVASVSDHQPPRKAPAKRVVQ